nr:UBN2 domain-containing protein [Tanacetum cinerariifolium]
MIELMMHTEKNDMVFHTKKIGMLRLVVEIDVGGMTADVVDKVTCSFDDLQQEQVDLKYVHALNKPHLHDIRIVPNRHEVDQQEESIDNAFARFNTIITSLKALDEGFSSKNYVRKFLRALHPKWRAKLTAIEESKDLTSLSLDELIGMK